MKTSAPQNETDRAGTLGELLRVSVPLVISAGSTAMMYVIDRIFLSWDSVESMAAALPAGVLHFNLAYLAIGTVAYTNAFIGQYEGAGKPGRIGPVMWQGIYVAIIASLLMLLVLPVAPYLFAWFNHGAEIEALELRYYRILCLGTLALLLDTALSCFFSGRGQTRVIMVVNTLGMLVNVGLDYLLIFGKAGFPQMGIEGAVLATVLAFASISAMYAGVMVWSQRGSPYRLWAGRGFDRELFLRLLRFGLPAGLQQFLDIACWNVFIQLIGGLGTAYLSATSLVFNLNALVFVPLLGLGTAVTALVGQRIGEGRPKLAARTTWMAFAIASLYVGTSCVFYIFAPEAMLRPYGLAEQDGVRELVVFLLRFVAVFSLFDAMAVVFNSAIRGAGDTRFPLVFSFSLGIVLLVLPTYVASFWGRDGFYVAWYAITIFVTVLGLGYLVRFWQGKWMTMRVIELTPTELDGEATEDDGSPALEIAAS